LTVNLKSLLLTIVVFGLSCCESIAADLASDIKDLRSLNLEIHDALSDIRLDCSYGKGDADNVTLTLEQNSTGSKVKTKLTREDVDALHGKLRNIIQTFSLKDSARYDERSSLHSGPNFLFEIRTPEVELMLRYVVLDRPRVDSAAECYFWLVKKFPGEWIKKVNWFGQFDLWK
jgi:hypothetical protein